MERATATPKPRAIACCSSWRAALRRPATGARAQLSPVDQIDLELGDGDRRIMELREILGEHRPRQARARRGHHLHDARADRRARVVARDDGDLGRRAPRLRPEHAVEVRDRGEHERDAQRAEHQADRHRSSIAAAAASRALPGASRRLNAAQPRPIAAMPSPIAMYSPRGGQAGGDRRGNASTSASRTMAPTLAGSPEPWREFSCYTRGRHGPLRAGRRRARCAAAFGVLRHRRPAERRQVDAAKPRARQEVSRGLGQAADHARPHRRRAHVALPGEAPDARADRLCRYAGHAGRPGPLRRYMRDTAIAAATDADVVLVLVDATDSRAGPRPARRAGRRGAGTPRARTRSSSASTRSIASRSPSCCR